MQSLREGRWFKLICGASFQHLPAIRNLTLAYALAGADCVDVAADPAVVHAAKEGLAAAARLGCDRLPWLMVSLNDGEDPHFRKAVFDPARCPADCPRPCETICPAQAITFERSAGGHSGVIESRCYGCGRCLPLCPIQQIETQSTTITPEMIPDLLGQVDALEIHTQVGRLAEFQQLWRAIAPVVHRLKLVAISCPDGDGLIDYLRSLYQHISPEDHPLSCPVIWQTDGRPMSGDIGAGTTRATVKLGQKVLAAGLPGYVQLAGGTNHHTVPKLRSLGLLSEESTLGDSHEDRFANCVKTQPQPAASNFIAGVAYGSYARVLLSPILDQLDAIATRLPSGSAPSLQAALAPEAQSSDSIQPLPQKSVENTPAYLENHPDLLAQAVTRAIALVSQLKPPPVGSALAPAPADGLSLAAKSAAPWQRSSCNPSPVEPVVLKPG
ncbi:MAG: LdpA C-terminal domain-containing domain [Cyanobacteriota bacterium]